MIYKRALQTKTSRWGSLILAVLCGIITLGGYGTATAQGAARLDPTFADNGIFIHQDDFLSPAFDAVEDRKGRLVFVGWNRRGNYLLRMHPNGALDQSFGNRVGVAHYPAKIPGGENLTIDSYGRILTLIGPDAEGPIQRSNCISVTRWPSDGDLPPRGSFNQRYHRGTAAFCLRKGPSPFAGLHTRDINLTGSGKILVSGTYYGSSQRQGGFFARIEPNGTLDRSLRGDRRTRTIRRGIVKLLPERGFTGSFRDIRPLAGGKVLVGGFLRGRFMAARYERDGSLDRSFGKNGVSTFDLDGDPACKCSFGMAMVRDYNKRILIAGDIAPKDDFGSWRIKVIRLHPNGRLDRSFGKNGVAVLPKGMDTNARAIAVQQDGRIVVAGEFDGLFGLARFTTEGELDPTFFEDGIFSDYVFGTNGEAWDVMIDRKGRIVASGGSFEGNFAVMRFLPR